MLLDEWRKFKGWAVLEFFLNNNRKIHIKALARELKISPRTAQIYLDLYQKNRILEKEKVGNLALYALSSNYLALEFKTVNLSILIQPYIMKFVQKNPDISSLVLYGSGASGEYDEKSDVDLLAISNKNILNLEPLKELEKSIKKEVKIEIMRFANWKSLESKSDDFYISVVKRHIVLFGANI
jgi:predicted nucleotidyltransferase